MEDSHIQETIKKILEFFGIEDPEINTEEKENSIRVSLIIPNAGLLIGKDGEILQSLEHLIKAIIGKKGIEKHLILDINNYRLQKENYIKEMAQKAGRQAMLTKKEIYLPAMNSYQRRLVHLELSINPDIATESIGQEPERRIVIRPRT